MTAKPPLPFCEATRAALARAPRWWLGLSGGCDSVALLHALRALPEAKSKLRALHVHHSFSLHADDWAIFCDDLCARWQIPLTQERVIIRGEHNLEARAREARYQAFSKHLDADDVLVTAHHQDDQAETFLLRLMRGAGVRGLGGMHAVQPFARGELLRPLLGTSRAEIDAYARANALEWISDESNADQSFDRNYLRHTVLPALRARWPQAAAQIATSAAWSHQADELLADYAQADLRQLELPQAQGWLDVCAPLDFSQLTAMARPRQRLLVSQWLRVVIDSPLPRVRLEEWLDQVAASQGEQLVSESMPQLRHKQASGTVVLAAYQSRLHVLTDAWQQSREEQSWALDEASLEFAGLPFSLHVEGDENALRGVQLEVCWRKGGEKWAAPGGNKSLKKMLQAKRVPPWERGALPLLSDGACLLWSPWFGDSEEKKKSVQYQKLKFSLRMQPT